MARHISGTKPSRRGKVMAILAGGAVIGLGTTATLASWTDTEWVFGGTTDVNGDIIPGVGTSIFEVEQNVSTPYVSTGFLQNETNPGESLIFTSTALALSPGTSTYAAVALRTVTASVGGDLTLQAAVPAAGFNAAADVDDLLWNALTVRASVTSAAVTCDASAFLSTVNAGAGPVIVASGALGTAIGTTDQSVSAASGNVQHYCFEVTLPTVPTVSGAYTVSDLQDRLVAPAWEFSAVSN
ncbi:acyl-CoA dehydrogenase [Cryobacterium melibiosiphilum]|uniref:Acyl-CoA dehydrogenase n=1 Tax=Cryobacterium melibiosiphilum TaxID=995039 RepID=A0A3A5MKS4_9MICO|nr:SipW-dependent-type signal peptide-containing protein [Cryobacterium melibiosiphilum]RJT88479.1 acyl-CoA dehydrogenase [Cryobacterium melibiosiphilum]